MQGGGERKNTSHQAQRHSVASLLPAAPCTQPAGFTIAEESTSLLRLIFFLARFHRLVSFDLILIACFKHIQQVGLLPAQRWANAVDFV